MILRSLLTFLTILTITVACFGTHNRAGEVTYRQIGPLTIEATVTTYTKASSTGADRDTIFVEWGDGLSEFIFRSNGNGEEIPGEDIKVNTYIQQHTYPANGRYTIAFQDPNRVNDIQNVNYPNSVDVPFYVQTSLTLIESQFQGPNNSVILLQPPIDFACAGQPFLHNPNAFDADGDSLSYALVTPLQAAGEPVPRYVRPDLLFPGPGNLMTIDEQTGDVVWDSPPNLGEYNIAIRINEYRQGVLLNSVIRDMQIMVIECIDTPPSIEVAEELCVVAGEVVNIPVTVTDVDDGQQIRLSATGGPFIQDFSPAILEGDFEYTTSPLVRNFIWETKCEHISDQYYTVIFRAQDNSRGGGTTGNSVLKTLRIKVLGPPPEDLQATLNQNSEAINVNWQNPYDCENALNDFFIGFRVYRRIGSNNFELDSCENGLDDKGYDIVRTRTNTMQNGRYVYEDNDVSEGKIYCYRVTGTFADQTSTGQPFNIVESIPSDEICMQLRQDVPLLTQVSVAKTDNTSGEISIKWVKPKIADFDTIGFPGPYRYKLLRSTDGSNYTAIYETTTPTLGPDVELAYTDQGLDSENTQYFYEVEFEAQSLPYSSSIPASSMKALLISSDRTQTITTDFEVPWSNYRYFLEKREGAAFQIIEEGSESTFTLTNLENDLENCYRVLALGTYRLDHTPDTIFNYSQVVCGTPLDTIGPCTPLLTVDNPCDRINEEGDVVDFVNILTWNIDPNCLVADLASFNIYYSTGISSELTLIGETSDRELRHIPELGINGCYYISAIDSLGNEGPLSEPICVPNCPIYVLPNTFTPNGDGANDVFIPRENKFVSHVDFVVYNRWGNELFQTSDPQINWNGQDSKGNDLDPGTFYYVCRVFENGARGVTEHATLDGYVQIFR